MSVRYKNNIKQDSNDSISYKVAQLLETLRSLQEQNPINGLPCSNGQVKVLIELFELLMLQKGQNPITDSKVNALMEQLGSIISKQSPMTDDKLDAIIEQLDSIIKEQNPINETLSSDDEVKPVIEQPEPTPKDMPLKKELSIKVHIQDKINEYLKQPWISADRKKTANELKDGIAKFKGNTMALKELSSLLLNAQDKILQQDKKRQIFKKKYSRLHQVIGNIIEDVNFRFNLERQLDEARTNPRIEGARANVECIKNVLPDAQIQRDLKNSAKLIRCSFKPFYKGFNAKPANKTEEIEATEQQTMPTLNSRG